MFVEEYLQDLRRERFSLRAMAVYVRRVSGRAREQFVVNPGAVRSVWSVAVVFFAGAFVAAAVMAVAAERRLAYDFFLATVLTILPVFALVTLHLDLLRDGDDYRLSALNLPTALTLLRLCLAPGIVLFLLRGHLGLALGFYLAAMASDVVDGWLARRWRQTTQLGTILDPMVDILFNAALFTALAQGAVVPWWVAGVALLRYGILVIGGAALYLLVGPVRIYSTLFGKLTGVVLSTLVAFLLFLPMVPEFNERLAPLTRIALGALLIVTVGQVVALGWYNLRTMTGRARVQGQVVGDVRWGAR